MVNEPFLMDLVGFWTTNETSFTLAGVCQGLDPLETPYALMGR